MSDVRICAVPPWEARNAVGIVRPLLMKAREYGDRGAHGWRRKTSDPSTYPTIEEIVADIEKRRAGLWVIMDARVKPGHDDGKEGTVQPEPPTPKTQPRVIAAWITRIKVDAAGRRAVEVGILGGERGREWFPLLHSRMHEFRKAEGAELCIWTGRKAWRRIFGLTPVGVAENGLWIYEDQGTSGQGPGTREGPVAEPPVTGP